VKEIIAFHLWHPTRQPPGPMTANPNYQRFGRRDLPVVCEHGLRNPLAQHEVSVSRFGEG
jgi:hypothetical protein